MATSPEDQKLPVTVAILVSKLDANNADLKYLRGRVDDIYEAQSRKVGRAELFGWLGALAVVLGAIRIIG